MKQKVIKQILNKTLDYTNKYVLIKLKNNSIIIGKNTNGNTDENTDDYCTINTIEGGKKSKKVLVSDIENIHLLDEGIIAKNGKCLCNECNQDLNRYMQSGMSNAKFIEKIQKHIKHKPRGEIK